MEYTPLHRSILSTRGSYNIIDITLVLTLVSAHISSGGSLFRSEPLSLKNYLFMAVFKLWKPWRQCWIHQKALIMRSVGFRCDVCCFDRKNSTACCGILHIKSHRATNEPYCLFINFFYIITLFSVFSLLIKDAMNFRSFWLHFFTRVLVAFYLCFYWCFSSPL